MTVTRWPGKPTSGRYVYRCVSGWTWQCDLHPDSEYTADGESQPWMYGPVVPTMRQAFDGALSHAALVCEYSNTHLTGATAGVWLETGTQNGSNA